MNEPPDRETSDESRVRVEDERASMREVAERANVAISSVSRVLSDHPDVSERMRKNVLAAVEELDYEPDFLAQSLRRGQTLSVGFVLADISNPLLAEIVLGAETELRSNGYSLLLMNSENERERDVGSVRFFQTRRVDGMLLSITGESDPALARALRSVKVPIVLVDRKVDPAIGASSVHNDHATGMADAVRHLIEVGHRRIALIAGSRDVLPGREREEALRATVSESNIAVDITVANGTFSRDHGRTATSNLLDHDSPPTAIVCGSNQVLVGCLEVMHARGIHVGRDVSVVTCDDIPASLLYQPPIASISRDTVGLGRAAAALLLRRLRDGGGPETVVLPTAYKPRASVAPPRVD